VRIDGSEVDIEVRRIAEQAQVGTRVMRTLVTHWTALLETAVKRHASGRPGPRIVTGNYNRSITRTVTPIAGGAEGEVGTNAVQAARLEYGFHGRDSLGRLYDQPPYPHFRPAADEIEAAFAEAVAAAAVRAAAG
jgi:hypothetical protein